MIKKFRLAAVMTVLVWFVALVQFAQVESGVNLMLFGLATLAPAALVLGAVYLAMRSRIRKGADVPVSMK